MADFYKNRRELINRLPLFLRRALCIGPEAEHAAQALRRRGLDEVYAFTTPQDPWPFPNSWFDAILLFDHPDTDTLKSATPLLASNGYILILHHEQSADAAECKEVISALTASGFGLYGYYTESDERLYLGVRKDYNPVVHARALFDKARHTDALAVLLCVPEIYIENDDVEALIVSESLLYMLAIDAREPAGHLNRFVHAQKMFYQTVAKSPFYHPLYQYQAEFWRRIGDTRVARAMLQSILHVAPDEATSRQLESIREPAPAMLDVPLKEPPTPQCRPRILFITHQRPHYGLDVLYDGLCRVLGDDHVVDYPYKAFLHGTITEQLKHYPCACNHAGRNASLEEIVDLLRDGWFDIILYGDIEQDLPQSDMRRIVHEAKCPIYLVDQQDECDHPLQSMLQRLDLDSVAGIFKREMLSTCDYGPGVHPLPFSYPDAHVAQDIDTPRARDIFWAGHRQLGLRRLYLERIEQKFKCRLDYTYAQADYKRAILESRIGINIFGLGYDTVRYWELPAHGCMLLSERLPIRIPNNFIDGQSAVFFDSLPDLEDKLAYYLAHPAEQEAIARAGHRHLLKYHTASTRARQLLSNL